MSADNTIAVFEFNDGKYRVGHFQNVEDFYDFKWEGSGENHYDMWESLVALHVWPSLIEALKQAEKLESEYDYVEYGIQIIRLDIPSDPYIDGRL